MEAVQYVVIVKTSLDKLTQEVNRILALNDGWRPQGGIFREADLIPTYYQAMIRFS